MRQLSAVGLFSYIKMKISLTVAIRVQINSSTLISNQLTETVISLLYSCFEPAGHKTSFFPEIMWPHQHSSEPKLMYPASQPASVTQVQQHTNHGYSCSAGWLRDRQSAWLHPSMWMYPQMTLGTVCCNKSQFQELVLQLIAF